MSARAQYKSKCQSPSPTKQLTNTRDSLHDAPPLLPLLLFGSESHHLAVVAHGSSGLVHVALEGPVEPAADEAWGVTRHFSIAGTALAVVLAAALLVVQVAKEARGGGGRLRCKWSVVKTPDARTKAAG